MGSLSPRILIADDHAIFADALRVYLEKSKTVVGTVKNGQDMVAESIRLNPDVVVADVGMPILNGLDAARRIKEQNCKITFVFLTMHDDANLAAAALGLRPVGFVLKHSAGSELLKAIDCVLRGKCYMTPKLRNMDWVEAETRAQRFSKGMTARQREVTQLVAEGRPIKEIAWLLGVSEKTIEFHKRHVMNIFNLKSNAELILFALKQGLITMDA